MEEPYKFRDCSPAMQAYKNRYWEKNNIKIVLPPGFTGTKVEIAHCVLVLGCLLNVKEKLAERGYYGYPGHRADVLKDVYAPDKDLAPEADRAYHHYKCDGPLMLGWIEWVLLNNSYEDVLHKDAAEIRTLARLAALADI